MIINISNLNDQMKKGIKEIQTALNIEASEKQGKILNANFTTNGKLSIYSDEKNIDIECSNLPAFYKAISMINANNSTLQFSDPIGIKELGAMIDCSRNGVLSVSGAKLLIKYFALMGYNYIMLYTEDTIEVKDYPYFGYLRGRYSKQEIGEIETYCDIFGIELIPCIQTLAHLNQAFRWDSFKEIWDTDDILLAGDDKTYQFIESLIKTCSEYYRTRKIHIGMDEANHLGLGKYLKINGLQNRMEVMLKHLERVISICSKYDMKPMIWDDMFFHFAGGDDIPQEVINMTPKEVALVYWNYYTQKKERYEVMFSKHLKFNNDIVFAAGAWSWGGIVPDNLFSIGAAKAAIPAAKEKGINNVMITLWGDDGSECSFLSMLPSLMVYSELNYNREFNETALEKNFKAMTGINYKDYLLLDTSPRTKGIEKDFFGFHPAKYLLFQDTLAGIFDLNLIPYETANHYKEAAKKLNELLPSVPGVFEALFKANKLLCEIISLKADLGLELRKNYREGNKEVLQDLANNRITLIISLIENFHEEFHKVWLQMFKSFGWEIQDIRYGGLIMRLNNVRNILLNYVENRIDVIEELEENILPYGGFNRNSPLQPYADEEIWKKIVSVNVLHHN